MYVMLAPTLSEIFTVVGDLDTVRPLPPLAGVRRAPDATTPTFGAARGAPRSGTPKSVRLLSSCTEPDHRRRLRIEANAFALHSVNPHFEVGPLPNPGYFVTANLSVPIWDWGSLQSKLSQAQVRRRQATVELTQAQRLLIKNLYSTYNEAQAARVAADNTRQATGLAEESLRLTALRYQAGESTALEVVDAQNTLMQVRGAYADASCEATWPSPCRKPSPGVSDRHAHRTWPILASDGPRGSGVSRGAPGILARRRGGRSSGGDGRRGPVLTATIQRR